MQSISCRIILSRKCCRPAAAAACLALLTSTATFVVPAKAYYSSTSYQWTFGGNTFISIREQDGTITVSPNDEEKQSTTVVICHGLGDTAEGFVDVAEVSAPFVFNGSFFCRPFVCF